MSPARQLGLVFAGGAVGGAARIGIGELAPDASAAVPWDVLVINVLGSLLLAAAVAITQARGRWVIFPAVGPGLLGGFTTFSAIAGLQWSTGATPVGSALVLASTIAASVLAAFAGWWLGNRPPTPLDEHAVFEEENE